MTGLEKMVSQILEEADASAAVTISDAEKKAAEILREAGEKADKDPAAERRTVQGKGEKL